METQLIKPRISIGKQEHGDVGVIYGFNILKSLSNKKHHFFKNDTPIDIGTQIEFEGNRYEVEKIRTVILGDGSDYNFEIMYFVKDI